MIITTTNSVDGYRIVHYVSPIFSSIITRNSGAIDIAIDFANLSSRMTKLYQDEVSDLHTRALSELESKASDLGANCVVGARFDLSVLPRAVNGFTLNAVATAVVIKTDQEIAEEADAELRAYDQREEKEAQLREREAQRRERFATADSLSDLLKDPAIAAEARKLRRIHGRDVGLSYLKQKASELGLSEINLTEDDLPADF